MVGHRTTFIPRNNLDSNNSPPTFRPQTPSTSTDQSSICSSGAPSLHLPSHSRRWELTASTNEVGGKSLSELGDSSSLFSFQSPPEFGSPGVYSPHLKDQTSIPFKLGSSTKHEQRPKGGQLESNMVTERAPAKAPLYPVLPNEKPPPPREAEGDIAPKNARLSTPQFGLTSMPQSPLNRSAQKESNVFIQAKSRPEHHRDANNTGMLFVNL